MRIKVCSYEYESEDGEETGVIAVAREGEIRQILFSYHTPSLESAEELCAAIERLVDKVQDGIS